MNVADFDFDLPDDLIAQEPPAERGGSRLLVLDRVSGRTSHHQFSDLPSLLRPGDLLVVNDTRVFAARLLGRRLPGGGAAECLLVRRLAAGDDTAGAGSVETWEALVHPGQRLRAGSRFEFQGDSVRFAAGDAEVGRMRKVLEQRVQAVNGILSGGRAVEP